MVKAKEWHLNIKDESLVQYYDNRTGRALTPIFCQRIVDSPTYILIFPTGLLLQVGINPF